MKEETDTLRDCLDGWDGKVFGDELAALASYEASEGGGSGASSLAMAGSLKLALEGSMIWIVAAACQQKEALDGLAEGNSLSTNGLEVSRRKRNLEEKYWSLSPNGIREEPTLCGQYLVIRRSNRPVLDTGGR